MRLRELEGVKGNGRVDALRADWHVIKPDPDNDLRDLTTPENRLHIERTKDSIEAEGVKDPLTVRTDGDDNIFAVDGRVRLTALAELEAEKRPVPEFVIVLQERERTTREQRLINMLIQSTQRKNYDQFEVARGIKRLHDFFNVSPEKIAERMGWKSIATVNNYLDDLAMEPETQKLVNDKTVSMTVARAVTREHGPKAPAIIKEAKAHAEADGKKNARATPRAVAKVTGTSRPRQTSMPLAASPNAQGMINLANEAARLAVMQGVKDKPDDELVQVPASFLKSARELHLGTATPLPPHPPQGDAEPAQDTTPRPAPVAHHIDLLPALIELAKHAKHVLERNRSDECPGGYWTQELVDAVRVAERVIGLCGNGRDPFAHFDSVVEETKALAEGEHV